MIARRRADARATPVLLICACAFGLYAATHPAAAQSGTYAAIYAIAAIGLSVLLGNVNQISLGQAGFFAIGAYALAYLTTALNWPFLPAAIAGITLAAAAGAIVGVIALRFHGHYLAMATLAFGFIVTGVLRVNRTFGGVSGIQLGAVPAIGPFAMSGASGYAIAWVIAGVVAVVTLILLRGRTGRAFEAIRNDELAAEVCGIPARRYKIGAFAYAGALAGLAGALYAAILGIVVPEAVGVALSIDLLLMVVLGGRGYVSGAIVGATLIAVLAISGQQFENWREVAYGIVVIAVVAIFPAGIAGVFVRRRERTARAAPAAITASAFPRVAPATVAAPPLSVAGMTKTFGGLTALDDVSFMLERGTLTSLIGPNGAGKTTLFNAIVGIGTVERGRVSIGETNVTGRQPHAIASLGVSRTFQNTRLFGDMTVLENVMAGAFRRERGSFVANVFGTPSPRRGREAVKHARTTLARLGMESLADVVTRDLPFGARRRVELARALAAEPSLLLVDEPAAGLNASERASLRDDLLRIRASGMTILLVEHDMRLVMSISDRVMVLQFGRLIADGKPATVRNDPAVIAAYLGTAE